MSIIKYGETSINKYREMQDSRLTKGIKVLRREGIIAFSYRFLQYLKRRALTAATPLAIAILPKSTFAYEGKKLHYCLHQKSLTWTNERAIEIPIAMYYIKNSNAKRILEVGAVLPHYYPDIHKDVIDKFEKGAGITNIDVLDFKPKERYDLIVSISTLEHVGFDDDVKDPLGTLKAVEHLKNNCLRKHGKLIVTLPINYNKHVDNLLKNNRFNFSEEYYYMRKNMLNRWKQTSKEHAMRAKEARFRADAVVVGVINK